MYEAQHSKAQHRKEDILSVDWTDSSKYVGTLTDMNAMSHSVATALATRVLPVPKSEYKNEINIK